MRILFLGDIVGRPGRKAVCAKLPALRRELSLDLVVANGENASGGLGINPDNALQLRQCGVDVLTSGNHIWRHKKILPFFDKNPWLLRPANYPQGAPGKGVVTVPTAQGTEVTIVNLMGRTYMEPIDCPFQEADKILQEIPDRGIVLVDFHAEATSEKRAMGYHLKGRVTCVLGTHTHVQTNDCQIMDHTAYITDTGMCGPMDSILGMKPEIIVRRFNSALPERFSVAKGKVSLQGVLLTIDQDSGRALKIEPFLENDL